MSDLEIREVPESDADRMLDLADLVFHHRTDDDARERLRWVPRRAERIGAYSGDDLVGQLGALPMRMSVPGGVLDCSAITLVGVLPTHRRRGVLTAMIGRMFADAIAAGRPVAALWASQGGIYGRYGFGPADRAISVEIDTSRPLGLRVEPDPCPLRLIDPAEAPEVLGSLHARAIERRAGGLVRDAEWWARAILPSVNGEAESCTEPRIVVADGGYAIYRTRRGSSGAVRLEDLQGESSAVEAALWRYLAEIDLTDTIYAPSRPVDDLIQYLVTDPDQVEIDCLYGALWVRLIDVPAALRARSWAGDDRLVIQVEDAHVPANQGRWRLGDGRCARTTDEPDISLGVADLGAAYLGEARVRLLARAGLVTEHTPGAAERLDRALEVPYAPYTNDDF